MPGAGPIYEDKLLDPAAVRLFRSPRGDLVMRVGEQEYRDLHIRRAFPLEVPDRFIGFFLPDGQELGLLEDPAALDPDSRRALAEELGRIYFCPVILRIRDIGEEFGVLHADLETSSGPRQIEVRELRTSIRVLAGHRAVIEDVDGNRYELRDWHLLPRLTREILGL
jgi:hypothetical protein